jgi:hypothetical protein
MKPFCILIDIDGTLALKGKRDPYDFSKVSEDLLNLIVHDVISAYLSLNPDIEPIFISGRSDICIEDTLEWLFDKCLFLKDSNFQLFMRNNEDYRNDFMVKEEIYLEKIAPYYLVKLIFDDRDSVVKMWRSHGLTCFQVADGDF